MARRSGKLVDHLVYPEVVALSEDVEAIRNDLHRIEFFQHGATIRGNELQVLRRWNSHTPMLHFSHGGGYLLRWRGKGTVIDPGVTFLDVFQRPHPVEQMKPHRMDDIDLMLVTHDHVDHCEDLGMLLVFLRDYNKWRKDKHKLPRTLDLVQSIGAHFRSVILLDNAENRKSVHAIDVPPPRPEREQTTHDPLDLKAYNMDLEEFSADHTEVLGCKSALGFRMRLHNKAGGTFVYCDTGDTSYNSNLTEEYRNADLLLLHVGTMEDVKKEPNGRGEHLCFSGVVKILKDLKRHGMPKLVLLGEWGEEFRGPGYRQRFADLVREIAGYHGPVLPADLGMRIQLDDRCRVMCRRGKKDKQWTAPEDVVVFDWGQWIEYHVS